MKPYGIPRTSDIESPDVADIHAYGLKTRAGRTDGRSYHRSSANKARARRIWKRKARRANRSLCTTND
jgi:hypothetical protein